jgi:hypothetical protein
MSVERRRDSRRSHRRCGSSVDRQIGPIAQLVHESQRQICEIVRNRDLKVGGPERHRDDPGIAQRSNKRALRNALLTKWGSSLELGSGIVLRGAPIAIFDERLRYSFTVWTSAGAASIIIGACPSNRL